MNLVEADESEGKGNLEGRGVAANARSRRHGEKKAEAVTVEQSARTTEKRNVGEGARFLLYGNRRVRTPSNGDPLLIQRSIVQDLRIDG